MGFCGCSLYASTISAGIYGITISIYGIIWTSVVINAINKWWLPESILESYYDTVFSTSNLFYLQGDKGAIKIVIIALVPKVHTSRQFKPLRHDVTTLPQLFLRYGFIGCLGAIKIVIIALVLKVHTSRQFKLLHHDVTTLPQLFLRYGFIGCLGIYAIVVVSLIYHLIWFLSSIAMLIGNERKLTVTLQLWVGIVSFVLTANFIFALYCILKPSDCGIFQFDFAPIIAGKCYAYLLLAVFFNKLGLITMGIEIALAIYVSSRVKEIKRELFPPAQVMVCPAASQYVVPAGHDVTMQPFPFGVQQVPSNGGQGWNQPPPFTEHGQNVIEDYRLRKY